MRNTTRYRFVPFVALLLGLLLVLPVAAYNAAGRSRSGADVLAATTRRQQQVDRIVADLRPPRLVYAIDQDLTIGEKTVTLKRLAVDRDAVFLEYDSEQPQHFMFDLLEGSSQLATAFPGLVYTEFNAGPDPNAATLTIRVRSLNGDPPASAQIPVTVDLSALRQLTSPQSFLGGVTTNGMRFEVSRFRRGYAVTSVDLRWTVVSSQDLHLTADPPRSLGEGVWWSLGETGARSSLTFFPVGTGEIDPSGWYESIQILDVPAHGQLEFWIDRVPVVIPSATGEVRFARGPWDLSATIPQSQ